jgi:predicted negative regulator of RcsB-dependent stress response
MTKTGEAAQPPMELDSDSILETIKLRQREITIGVIAVIAIAAGAYLWRESAIKNDERAERALNTASSSYFSGNKALAQSDLEKMVDRYSGTAAGVQGAMLLSEILFENGKWDDGIKRLEAVKGPSASRFGASIEGLIAGAYADEKKYDDAAKHYLAGAAKAEFPADKDLYQAEAARVLNLAGKKEDARKIWAELSSRADSPAIGEAKIRLGELESAAPAKP